MLSSGKPSADRSTIAGVRLPAVDVDAEHLLTGRAVADLEARLLAVVAGDDQQQAAVERRLAGYAGKRDAEPQRAGSGGLLGGDEGDGEHGCECEREEVARHGGESIAKICQNCQNCNWWMRRRSTSSKPERQRTRNRAPHGPFNQDEGITWKPDTMIPALRQLLNEPATGLVLLARDPLSGAAAGYGIVTFGFDIEYSGRDACHHGAVRQIQLSRARRRPAAARCSSEHIAGSRDQCGPPDGTAREHAGPGAVRKLGVQGGAEAADDEAVVAGVVIGAAGLVIPGSGMLHLIAGW